MTMICSVADDPERGLVVNIVLLHPVNHVYQHGGVKPRPLTQPL